MSVFIKGATVKTLFIYLFFPLIKGYLLRYYMREAKHPLELTEKVF